MKKVILDVDTGVDDAIAILFALKHPDVEVLAITCSWGNTSLDDVCRNSARICQTFGYEIPVFRGCGKSLLDKPPDLGANRFTIHGADGLGDVDWPDSVDLSNIQSEHAVNALIRIAKENSGEVTVLTFGALTNLAVALSLEPDLADHLQNVYTMGGNTDGCDPCLMKEFNFTLDPEAVSIVLGNTKNKLRLLARDECDKTEFSKEWVTSVLKKDTASSKFIHSILKTRLQDEQFESIRVCDFVLMVAVADPEAVISTSDASASVELEDGPRGLLSVEWNSKTPNVHVFDKICYDSLQKAFIHLLED